MQLIHFRRCVTEKDKMLQEIFIIITYVRLKRFRIPKRKHEVVRNFSVIKATTYIEAVNVTKLKCSL